MELWRKRILNDGESVTGFNFTVIRCSIIFFLWFGATVIGATGAQAQPPVTKRETLPNGLRLLVEERAGSALTAVEITVKSGSGAQMAQDGGAAHLIEHLVFRGSAKRKPGEADIVMESLGGEILARTTRDVTQYSVILPSAKWREGLTLLAEIVRSPAFLPNQIAREKKVVRQEMAVAESEPGRLGFDRICSVAFPAGDPYTFPLMGTLEAMESLSLTDLRQFHKSHYLPGNMSVALIGAVNSEESRQTVMTLFPETVTVAPPPEAPMVTIAIDRVSRTALTPASEPMERELSTVIVGFPIPSPVTPELIPLMDVLMALLADGQDGFLPEQLLKKERVAISVAAEWFPMRRGSLLMVTASGRPKNSLAIERSIIEEIRRLRDDGVPANTLENAKRTAQGRARYAAVTVEGRARQLSMRDVWNPALTEDNYAKALEEITTEDIRAAIIRYLTPSRYAATIIADKASERQPASGNPQ